MPELTHTGGNAFTNTPRTAAAGIRLPDPNGLSELQRQEVQALAARAQAILDHWHRMGWAGQDEAVAGLQRSFQAAEAVLVHPTWATPGGRKFDLRYALIDSGGFWWHHDGWTDEREPLFTYDWEHDCDHDVPYSKLKAERGPLKQPTKRERERGRG